MVMLLPDIRHASGGCVVISALSIWSCYTYSRQLTYRTLSIDLNMVNTSAIAFGIALFATVAAFLFNPIVLRLRVLGVLRQWNGINNVYGAGLTAIPDLFGVEDLHYHEPTGVIFGLTEENIESRDRWFPPYVYY